MAVEIQYRQTQSDTHGKNSSWVTRKIEPAVTTQGEDSEVMISTFIKCWLVAQWQSKNQLLGILRIENKTEHHQAMWLCHHVHL